jgi:hypothetical protein
MFVIFALGLDINRVNKVTWPGMNQDMIFAFFDMKNAA